MLIHLSSRKYAIGTMSSSHPYGLPETMISGNFDAHCDDFGDLGIPSVFSMVPYHTVALKRRRKTSKFQQAFRVCDR